MCIYTCSKVSFQDCVYIYIYLLRSTLGYTLAFDICINNSCGHGPQSRATRTPLDAVVFPMNLEFDTGPLTRRVIIINFVVVRMGLPQLSALVLSFCLVSQQWWFGDGIFCWSAISTDNDTMRQVSQFLWPRSHEIM